MVSRALQCDKTIIIKYNIIKTITRLLVLVDEVHYKGTL